jgi:hypothetical protein
MATLDEIRQKVEAGEWVFDRASALDLVLALERIDRDLVKMREEVAQTRAVLESVIGKTGIG